MINHLKTDFHLSRRCVLFLLPALFLLLLTSCVLNADSLFCLPQAGGDYTQLQEEVSARLAEGWEVAYPTDGDEQTAMHFADLSGNGTDDGVILLRSANTSELSLLVYVSDGEKYSLFSEFPFIGNAVHFIEFCDLDRDGTGEVVLGVHYGTEALYRLQVLDFSSDGTFHTLLSAEYTEHYLYDADSCGTKELLVIRSSTSGEATAILYTFLDGNARELARASLSSGVTEVLSITGGKIENDSQVACITGKYYISGYITDVLMYNDGVLTNVGYDRDKKINSVFLSSLYLTPADCDNDGCLEMPVYVSDASSSADYALLDWYRPTPGGTTVYDFSTIHVVSDGWYLRLPAGWHNNISVKILSGGDDIRHIVIYSLQGNVMVHIKSYPFMDDYPAFASSEISLCTICGRYLTVTDTDSTSLGTDEILKMIGVTSGVFPESGQNLTIAAAQSSENSNREGE